MTTHPAPARSIHRNRWRPAIWGGAALLLALPLVAMQFTREVNWTASDFVVMGLVLASACVAYEAGARTSGDTVYRAAFAVAVLGAFLLVWINLAVGIIGTEDRAANLMYLAVLAVASAGSLRVRLRADGMRGVMLATAAMQVLVPVLAMTADVPGSTQSGLAGVTVVFLIPWLAAAALFHVAARRSRRRMPGGPDRGPAPDRFPDARTSMYAGRSEAVTRGVALTALAIGSALMGLKIHADGEPGALPVLLVALGAVGIAITWLRSRRRRG